MTVPRVLHISLSDYRGGADIAALRIFRSVLSSGVDAQMAVRFTNGSNPDVNVVPLPEVSRVLTASSETIAARVQKSASPFHRSLNIVPTGGISLPDFTPDLVHLHWVGSNALSLREIKDIPVPVVWTLHDSWPFAGADHHPLYPRDMRFVTGYQRNNRVHSSRVDIDGWVWRRKFATWKRRFHLVAPSRWMAEQAQRSKLMGNQPTVTIPNPVDIEALTSCAGDDTRSALEIGSEEFVIVTAGIGGTNIDSKGWPLLRDALQTLTNTGISVHLLIIGQSEEPPDLPRGVKCTATGLLDGSAEVGRAMSAADVFITASTIESFGLTAAEASALGLPVIAPNTSGLTDVVVEGETGWLFDPESVDSLVLSITEAHADSFEAHHRGSHGRQRATNLWAMETVGRQYRDLYESILYQ